MQAVEERREAKWRGALGRAIKLVLHWLIKLVVVVILLAFRRKVVSVIALAAIVALLLLNGSYVRSVPWLSTALASHSNVPAQQFSRNATSIPPSPAAEQYLRGQGEYDAQAMWDVVDETKRSPTAGSGGITLHSLEQQLETAKKSDLHYDQASYVGGYLAPDGRGFYLYVVNVTSGSDTKALPYMFTTSKEGKILGVD